MSSLSEWLFGKHVPWCYEGGQRHLFVSVKTTETKRIPPGINGGAGWRAEDIITVMKAATNVLEKQTYHGDVCMHCGKVVNKP